MHHLDYHRSSFLFVSPLIPIQSIFISPSVPFTAAFISARSLNLRRPLFRNPSRLFTSSLASSGSLSPPVCHISPISFKSPRFIFPLTSKTFFFPLSTSIFLFIFTFIFSEALCGPINLFSLMSFPTNALGSAGQVKWFKGRRRQTDKIDLIV